MNQNFYDQDDPLLSREDAIAILNTPDDKLNDLIARAEGLGDRTDRYYCKNLLFLQVSANCITGTGSKINNALCNVKI